MIHSDDWVRALVDEVPRLYAQLVGELRPLADEPDRSTPRADLSPPDDDGPARLSDGRGAVQAVGLLSATVTGTPTRNDAVKQRGMPGSAAPLDLNALAAQEGLWIALDELLADLRYARGLPHRQGMWTLAGMSVVMPLIDGLSDDQRATRWLAVGLARLGSARARARGVLGLDAQLLMLGPCPVVQEPYPAAWDASGLEVLAVWDDGLCRAFDVAASVGRDVWTRSHLRVDVAAGTRSPEGDIHCRTCGARWAGEDGRRELARLMA